MTGKKSEEREALLRLADAVAEDALKREDPEWPPRGARWGRSGARRRVILRLDPARARARLQQALERSPETAKRLTLAARKGGDLSDEDVLSMLEDLEELGIIPPDDDGADKS